MGSKAREPKKPLCVGAKPWLFAQAPELVVHLLVNYSRENLSFLGATIYLQTQDPNSSGLKYPSNKTTYLSHFFRHLRYSDSSKSSSPPTKWSLVEFLFPTCQQALQSLKQTARPENGSLGDDPFVLSFGLIQGRLQLVLGGSKVVAQDLVKHISLKYRVENKQKSL